MANTKNPKPSTFSQLVERGLSRTKGRITGPQARRLAVALLRQDGEENPPRSLWFPLSEALYQEAE
jgi:hypothetical protein